MEFIKKSPPTVLGERRSFCIDSLLSPKSRSSEGIEPTSPISDRSCSPASPPSPPSLHPIRPTIFPGVSPLPPLGEGFYGSPMGGMPPMMLAGSAFHAPGGPVQGAVDSMMKVGPMSMQTMQLEWLARTGMLYHRFPELAGIKHSFNGLF